MRQENKLTLKGRVTIFIKKRKPAKLLVLLLVSAALLAALIVLGQTSDVKTAAAPKELTNDVLFRMTVAGDITLDDSIRHQAAELGYTRLFKGVSKYWRDSDCVIANVSGPVLQYDVKNYTSRKGNLEEAAYVRPAALRGILEAGITLPSFANEDVFNYGITGINSTIRMLESYGAEYLGIAPDRTVDYFESFAYPHVTEGGLEVNRYVSVLSVNDIVQEDSTVLTDRAGVVNSTMASLYETVYELSRTSEYVVVYVHFGQLNSASVSEEQSRLARSLIDAGADLVIGTHSHMVQPVERYNDGLIVYGLGELLSTEDYSLALDGVLLDLVVENDGDATVYLTPTHIREGHPEVAEKRFYTDRIYHTLTALLDEEDYQITQNGLISFSLRAGGN